MTTYSPLSSLGGPRDHLDRLVADILDDADECPLEGADFQEDLLKSKLSQKDAHIQETKESEAISNSYGKNGRFSSGSSSNGESRDSGFDCGISAGSLSTPSSSRRTTSSSDNLSTPTLSSASESHSPSSEKMSSDASSFGINLKNSPTYTQENDQMSTALIKEDIENLFDSSLTSTSENLKSRSSLMNQSKSRSGSISKFCLYFKLGVFKEIGMIRNKICYYQQNFTF